MQDLTTLLKAKEYLSISPDVLDDDELLARLIAAASAFLLGEMRRESMNQEYSFAASYANVPADVEEACLEMVTARFKGRDRIGEVSKNLGGMTVSYSQKDMSDFCRSVVNRYRRVTP